MAHCVHIYNTAVRHNSAILQPHKAVMQHIQQKHMPRVVGMVQHSNVCTEWPKNAPYSEPIIILLLRNRHKF